MSKLYINEGMKKLKELRDSGEIEFKRITGDIKFKCQKDGRCCNIYPIVSVKGDVNLFKDSYETCKFLKNNQCSIYDKRPISCKAYPFNLDPLTEEMYYDIKCLGIGKGKIISQEDLAEIKEYRLKFWNSFSLTEKEKKIVHDIMFK